MTIAGLRSRTRATRRPYLLASALLPLVLYIPIVGHGFLLDDRLLYRSSSIDDLGSIVRGFTTDLASVRSEGETHAFGYYRPVFVAASTLYARVTGGSVASWHAASVALAAIIGALACSFLMEMGVAPLLAFFASAAFSVHPAHVSSVAWAAGLQELLAAAFALSSLVALASAARDEREKPPSSTIAVVCAVLALLSKEVAIALVPFVALWSRLEPSPAAARRLAGTARLLTAIAIAYLGLRVVLFGALAPAAPGAPGWAEAIAAIPVALRAYLAMLFWPTSFSFFRPERPPTHVLDPSVVVSLGIVGSTAVIAAALALRRRACVLPLAWFVVWLLPVLNVWALDPQWMVTDRYLFLPVLALPWTLAAALPERVAVASLAALVLAFTSLTLRYEKIFASEATFLAAMEEAEPTSALVFAEKGRLLLSEGDARGAEGALRRAIELGPRMPSVLVALADLELAGGDLASAEVHYRSAGRAEPSRRFRALVLERAHARDVAGALALAEAGARVWPADFENRLLHALLLGAAGDRAGAEEAFRRAGALRPDDPTIRHGLDAALANVLPEVVPPGSRD